MFEIKVVGFNELNAMICHMVDILNVVPYKSAKLNYYEGDIRLVFKGPTLTLQNTFLLCVANLNYLYSKPIRPEIYGNELFWPDSS